MHKRFAISVAFVLVGVLAIPVYAAVLEVSGKHVGSIMYDGDMTGSADSVTSINPGGITKGIDFLGMSTLYLDLDFTEGSLFEAHLPFMLFNDAENSKLTIISNPDDEYYLVYRGEQFTLSLTDAVEGDYAFFSLKDPLGLVREIDTDDMTVLKLTGKPRGMDVLGYLVSAEFTDKKGCVSESRYGAVRASYELPQGSCLGITWGIRRKGGNSGDNKNVIIDHIRTDNVAENINIDSDDNINADNVEENVSLDLDVPIPISKKATLQSAVAISKASRDGKAYGAQKALSFKIRKLKLRNITFKGDFITVEPGFTAVAHKKDSSDVSNHAGKRYLRGEGKTVFDIFGYDVKKALSYERTVNSDGSFDHEKGSSKHKVSGEAEFNLSPDVTMTVDRYIDKTLADTGYHKGDYTTRTRAKMSYESPKTNEVWCRLWQVEKEHKNNEGLAYKVEWGVKVKLLTSGKSRRQRRL